MKLVVCILLVVIGIFGILSNYYVETVYSQPTSDNIDSLVDIPSNFSFMLEPNIPNGSEVSDNNLQQSMNGSALNDLVLLEDQLKLAQEKIEMAGLEGKDWENYTSKSLGLSLEYPSEITFQKEGKETRFVLLV